MRLVAILVMFLLAVGAAVAQDDNTNATDGGDSAAANDTADGGGNATDGGEGGGQAAADCISQVTLVGKDDFKWYLPEGGSPNPRLAVCASAPVTFTIQVPGDESAPHNFVVQAPEAPPTTSILDPGQEEDYVWSTPEKGSFTYICLIHGSAMSGTVTVGAPAAPPAEGEEHDPVNGPVTQLQQVAPDATCDREIPALATREVVGGKTLGDYVAGCVQTEGDAEPQDHPADYLLPLSWALIGLGVVGVVWVHKYYKP